MYSLPLTSGCYFFFADEVALDSESRVTPLKNEKKKLFNELVSVKGDYAGYCSCQLKKLMFKCMSLMGLLHFQIIDHVLEYQFLMSENTTTQLATDFPINSLEVQEPYIPFWGAGNVRVYCRARPQFEDEGPPSTSYPDDFTLRLNSSVTAAPNKDFELDRSIAVYSVSVK